MTSISSVTPDERAQLEHALEHGVVVETSGSTEKPKRVVLSADALRASAAATAEHIGVGGWVLALPLSYIAGIMVGVRALVADQQLVDLRAEPFDAQPFAAAVTTLPEGTWFTSLVPAQLARLVDAAEQNEAARSALARFDAILVGGQAIPIGLVQRATDLSARIIRTYGSAETAGGVVYDGVPIGDTELRINEEGILEIRTSSLASGYHGDDERTARDFVDGWYRTSDRAHFDDGKLVVDGRADDVIITGGIKVSLGDIERTLDAHGVTAYATWYTDEEWGQVPALVTTELLNFDEIRDVIERELGKAARPYRIVRVDAIPLLESGKVDRRGLLEIVEKHKP